MCNTSVYSTPVLHMYCTHVYDIHLYYMCDACVLLVFYTVYYKCMNYMCNALENITQMYYICTAYVIHMLHILVVEAAAHHLNV